MPDVPNHLKRQCNACGELYPPTKGHDCQKGPKKTCPHCGDTFRGLDRAHDCDELPPTAGDTCPICGAGMDSWLSHMTDCPGPDDVDEETRAAGAGDGER